MRKFSHVSPVDQPERAEAQFVYCSGGISCTRLQNDTWLIEPISVSHVPSRVGCFAKDELAVVLADLECFPFAFEDLHVEHGAYFSSFRAITKNRSNHFETAAGFWSNVAGNIRAGSPSTLDAQRLKIGQLSSSISISFRCLDAAIGAIHRFYASRISYHVLAGKTELEISLPDAELFASVHSFYLHLGAARDYLGALIAMRLGLDRLDDLTRLLDKVKFDVLKQDELGKLLISRGLIIKAEAGQKPCQAGWLKVASALRRRFVHHQPFGFSHKEKFGRVVAATNFSGGFKYHRSFSHSPLQNVDVLDYLGDTYVDMMGLFIDLARCSGYDTSWT